MQREQSSWHVMFTVTHSLQSSHSEYKCCRRQIQTQSEQQRTDEGRHWLDFDRDTCWRLEAAVRLWGTACTKTPLHPVAVKDPPQAENIAWCGGQIPTPWIHACWNTKEKSTLGMSGWKQISSDPGLHEKKIFCSYIFYTNLNNVISTTLSISYSLLWDYTYPLIPFSRKKPPKPKFIIPEKNNNPNFTQFHSPCFNHAGPNFLKQAPHVLVRDWSSRRLTVFIVVIVHDDIRTRRVALLAQTHLAVERISSSSSCHRSLTCFWPAAAAYWKDCPSWRGHGGHGLTSSQTLSQAPSLLGGPLRSHCNPPFSLRKHNSHADET